MEDDSAKPLGEALLSALSGIAAEMSGDLHDFKRLDEFFEKETSHLPPYAIQRIKTAVSDLSNVCESHIEIIALAKIMAMNFSAEGQIPSYPIVTRERTPGDGVRITPQVKLGDYRADFVVDANGFSFLVECDGREFHDAAADARRDSEIERLFGMKTFRLSGSEIWKTNIWILPFMRWCRGSFVDRHLREWQHEWAVLLRSWQDETDGSN